MVGGHGPATAQRQAALKEHTEPGITRQFLLRVQDVIERYNPDMLYFDDNVKLSFDKGGPFAPDLGVWLGIPDLAPQIMAYYYNRNMHAMAVAQAVMDMKEVPEPVWRTVTRDFEERLRTRSR